MPIVKLVKKQRQEIKPLLNIKATLHANPTQVAEQDAVAELFSIDASQRLQDKEVDLPDYLLARGMLLFPFHGLTVEDLESKAVQHGISFEYHGPQRKEKREMKGSQGTHGWGMINFIPGHMEGKEVTIRVRENGHSYRQACLADGLAFAIWLAVKGGTPLLQPTRFPLSNKDTDKTYEVQYDPENQVFTISSSVYFKSPRHSALQQVLTLQ
jgi:hypothetical protein